jgi:hypothetical protein
MSDEPWNLNGRDSKNFVDAILTPSAPNEALIAAAERYKGITRDEPNPLLIYLASECMRLLEWNKQLVHAMKHYANPEIYKAHPHGPAFERHNLTQTAINALSQPAVPITGYRQPLADPALEAAANLYWEFERHASIFLTRQFCAENPSIAHGALAEAAAVIDQLRAAGWKPQGAEA